MTTYLEHAKQYLKSKGLSSDKEEKAMTILLETNRNLTNHWDTDTSAFNSYILNCLETDLDYVIKENSLK